MIDTGTSTKERGKPEAAPQVTMRPGIEGNYIPKTPGELAWIAVATNLRANIHPEIVNTLEAKAYLIEIGEASLAWPQGLVKDRIQEIPNAVPSFPRMKDPVDNMAAKIAVIELVSGYPHAMDPRYAKHTLLMGDVAFNAILECTKSPHTFLQHNAVAVLSNAQGQRAAEELRKIVETAADPVTLVRAAMGCSRKKDKKAIPALLKRVHGADENVIAAIIYALGMVGTDDPKVATQLANIAQGASTPDLAWSALAAVARVHCTTDKNLTQQLVAIKKAWEGKGANVPPPQQAPAAPAPGGGIAAPVTEPAGTKNKIVWEISILAAAASGDEASKKEALAKGIKGFNKQVWVLAAEVFPSFGPEGINAAKGVINDEEVNVGVAAVRAVGEFKEEVPWLKGIAASGKAVLRAAALTRLIYHDEEAIKEVCRPIVSAGNIGTAEEAFLTGMALQMLDRVSGNVGADVLSLVNKAKSANAIAKRTATDEYDVTKAKIEVFPPCLEIVTICVGRTQHEPAVDVLIGFLNDGSNPVRGEAALSLGSFGMPGQLKKVAEALLKNMVDPNDGWVRFCCYLSLRHLSGKDYPADFVFGAMSELWPSVVKYRDWLREQTKDDAPAPAAKPEQK
jgi:HEAT repeat protein